MTAKERATAHRLVLRHNPKMMAKEKAYQVQQRLKRSYNVTIKQYWRIFINQNYSCAICKAAHHGTGLKTTLPLFIDHDHVTGKVRGLLCSECNVAVGLTEKYQHLFQKINQYLGRVS